MMSTTSTIFRLKLCDDNYVPPTDVVSNTFCRAVNLPELSLNFGSFYFRVAMDEEVERYLSAITSGLRPAVHSVITQLVSVT